MMLKAIVMCCGRVTSDLSAALLLVGWEQDCTEGSKDFREEQCSQFDGRDFQGKRYKWLPYYGGSSAKHAQKCFILIRLNQHILGRNLAKVLLH